MNTTTTANSTAGSTASSATQEPSPYEMSKKELLEATGISYGQLYRWKREGLIPEEWFEKRSAFTGQETFFPRELILERVRAIQSMKDGLSLSEIREQLAKMPKQRDIRKTLLVVCGIDESYIDDLGVDFNKINLSEASIKAIATLSSALGKSEASEKAQSALIAKTIKTLNIKKAAAKKSVDATA